ncbi:hypothetical protein TraAM80_07480 [Trypanosoma rangeli]|uniref:FYVE-type domain-containing protein n=1 Tax=Trypanosoma rangeli TaxID=5698 RepID=A0A422N541_TRYRA|nr:uncharacterized protein TraAM80_07480 [Trypanosoma rangeli]RNF00576.1 hypothetical protein TraAM80_07480 [Trypanosoma rangeli]|eukprot:RNF00576.1 hypothetical protein TraAM80_07480 [Trypanosoma rangeli]
MGAIVTIHKMETAEAEVFDGVVPLDRKDFDKIQQMTFCPDCGRLFDALRRPRRCRVCGEALCKRCCLLCRNWKWRPICAHCMDNCLRNYYERTKGGSLDEVYHHEHYRRKQDKKAGSGNFLRGFFITAFDPRKLILAKKSRRRAERDISQGL